MKTFSFNETEGFNFGTQVLTEIQDAYSIFVGVAKMAGEKSILSGCDDLGTSISDGVIFLNGELLDFRGSLKQTTVIIKEERKKRSFENGSLKDYSTYRYATFGFATNSYQWSDFKRVSPLNMLEFRLSRLEKIAKPILEGNSPILFLKPANEIPEGYIEWTGASGLTLVGRKDDDLDYKKLGDVNGVKSITLEQRNLPPIRIGTPIYTQGGRLVDDNGPMDNIGFNANGSKVETEQLGLGDSIKVLNPYRIVNYIIYKL